MDMTCYPLIESGSYPEAVNTAGYHCEQEPLLDPVAKQLSAVSVESQSMDMGAGIKLTHTNGTSTVGCTFSSTENGAMISSSDMPLVTFSTPEFETSTYSKNFYIYPETFGKAGVYTGTMNYTFDCTPIQ